ncbi:MAG TPA: amidase family protein, partial [Actinomycetes bacterium]|nr:amidase family protein [Actinomycetes bacterium]
MTAPAPAPLVGRTATELAAVVREGRASPLEVVEAHLEWIASLEPSIHAFQAIRPDGVRGEARALASRADLRELPLAGVPVAIKDNLEMAGYPTRNGSLASSEEPAASDDELVRRLRHAGAVPLGKTTVPEL